MHGNFLFITIQRGRVPTDGGCLLSSIQPGHHLVNLIAIDWYTDKHIIIATINIINFRNRNNRYDFYNRYSLFWHKMIYFLKNFEKRKKKTRTTIYLNFVREESSQIHKVWPMVVKPTPEVIIEAISGCFWTNHSEMKLFSAWLVISKSLESLFVQ